MVLFPFSYGVLYTTTPPLPPLSFPITIKAIKAFHHVVVSGGKEEKGKRKEERDSGVKMESGICGRKRAPINARKKIHNYIHFKLSELITFTLI